jgi:hypothetical protein
MQPHMLPLPIQNFKFSTPSQPFFWAFPCRAGLGPCWAWPKIYQAGLVLAQGQVSEKAQPVTGLVPGRA